VKRTVQRYAKNGHNGNGSAGEICFDVASNPEFLQEGIAVDNLFHPDRVVCGVESDRAKAILEEIYRPFGAPVLMTGLCTAEITKHAANSFLAMKISFINMVGDLCEAVGADVTQVAAGLGMDPRISPGFLKAGIGFGGYCFPKDLRAFIHLADEFGLNFSLLKEVEAVNQQRVDVFVKKVRKALWVLRGKTLAVLGLAFKPGTDDTREAPSMKIIESLLAEGASLRLHDPRAIPILRESLPEKEGSIKYCDSPYEAAQHAHALLVLTEWNEYRGLDLAELRKVMDVPVVVDGRNIFDPARMREAGFEYVSVGR
jgi:UDPglucose 6-dehydrogenase